MARMLASPAPDSYEIFFAFLYLSQHHDAKSSVERQSLFDLDPRSIQDLDYSSVLVPKIIPIGYSNLPQFFLSSLVDTFSIFFPGWF